MNEEMIIKKLDSIEKKIENQSLLQKEILNFVEASKYLDISQSHLYKLTSRKQIPHFCPQGKRLFFNRLELNEWLQQNRQSTKSEIDEQASNYIAKNRKHF
jgi:excisionase family DNA binding protein